MTYAQAIKTGSKLDGYVKCTFAVIWRKPVDDRKERFFSFQQTAKNAYVTDSIGAYEPDVEQQFAVNWDYPLFEAVETRDATDPKYNHFVPVILTEWGWKEMIKCLKHPNQRTDLNPDDVWYVKDYAVDWMPTNIDNATIIVGGQEINIKDALAQAKEDIEKKKKLLIMAGAATLIL